MNQKSPFTSHTASHPLQPTHSPIPFPAARTRSMFLIPLDFFEVWVLFHLKGFMDPLTQHSTTPSHCPPGRENTPCGRLTVARTHSHSRNAAVTPNPSCDSTEPEPPSSPPHSAMQNEDPRLVLLLTLLHTRPAPILAGAGAETCI